MKDSLAGKLLVVMLALAFVGAYRLVLEVPTPWPPARGHVANNVSGENHAATKRRLVADGPGPVPWPSLTGSAKQVADGPGPVPWPTVGRVYLGSNA